MSTFLQDVEGKQKIRLDTGVRVRFSGIESLPRIISRAVHTGIGRTSLPVSLCLPFRRRLEY